MMKKLNGSAILILTLVLSLAGAQFAFAQKSRKTRKKAVVTAPKVAKPSAVKPEDDFQTRLLQILLTEEENWKEHSFPASNFKALFPRTPVFKEEKFADESFGTMTLKFYMSSGDSGVFGVGHIPLPYSITDETVLKDIYRQIAKEFFSGDEFSDAETKDILINERPGLELTRAKNSNNKPPFKMRIFLINRDIFYNIAMASAGDADDQIGDSKAKLEKETEDFFNSFTSISAPKAVEENVSPVFKSSYTDGVFKSDYFNFTIKIPKDWHEISQEDVSGIRESSREILKQKSSIKLPPKTNERRNLFSFSAKPLGTDANSTIACNIQKKPTPQATALQLSKETEQVVRKMSFFTITKPTHTVKINGVDFVGLEGKGNLGGQDYGSTVYICIRKEYAVVFTIIYFSDDEKALLTESLNSIKFAGR